MAEIADTPEAADGAAHASDAAAEAAIDAAEDAADGAGPRARRRDLAVRAAVEQGLIDADSPWSACWTRPVSVPPPPP